MFPEKGGQNSIFFPSALKKGGQNRGAYQPTSLKGCPPGLITAQQGVARPDWGRKEVRTITPGPHPHLGKLG